MSPASLAPVLMLVPRGLQGTLALASCYDHHDRRMMIIMITVIDA
jgi:hypothetical protein